ncbi:ABC transporter ATP-binding protein [Halomarina halobia]|uniref:ABC transporter ATP-binding protein n=1 Tax=Halomarina halobia TaxID=3033386 RepID=A0ABD6A937_9EURY|nr:ABC transporter ATP-binding protein [Halomarina sp. PSR21]
MGEPIITAADLVVRRGGTAVLDGLSLSVPRDASLLVRGKSGSGKTTLFNVLGLLATPDSGSVVVDGRDVSAASEAERARLRRDVIGFVFQDFQLLDDLTARENARVPQEHAGNVDDAWLDELFADLGIEDVSEQYPPSLSGGERQRVALARALANRPSVVLADEPTGQLDPETTEAVIELLFRTHERLDTALVVISHDPQFTRRFDRALVLEGGRLVPAIDSTPRRYDEGR